MAKKLLLADDSITIQKVVELILSDEDYDITTVGSGDEALSLIEQLRPDIVLADVDMPNINGYELCKHIKENNATSHISVVLLVGAFEPINEKKAKEAGAEDFLIKPFESHEFLSKINTVLSGKDGSGADEQSDDISEVPLDSEVPEELDDGSILSEIQDYGDDEFEQEDTEDNSDIPQEEVEALIGEEDSFSTKELENVIESLTDGQDEMEEPHPQSDEDLSETVHMDDSVDSAQITDFMDSEEIVDIGADDSDFDSQDEEGHNLDETAYLGADDEDDILKNIEMDESLTTDELKDVMDHVAKEESKVQPDYDEDEGLTESDDFNAEEVEALITEDWQGNDSKQQDEIDANIDSDNNYEGINHEDVIMETQEAKDTSIFEAEDEAMELSDDALRSDMEEDTYGDGEIPETEMAYPLGLDGNELQEENTEDNEIENNIKNKEPKEHKEGGARNSEQLEEITEEPMKEPILEEKSTKAKRKPVENPRGSELESKEQTKMPPATIPDNSYDMGSQQNSGVLLTTDEVVKILNRGLEEKVSTLVSENMITDVFKDAVNKYVNTTFEENFKNVNGVITESIDNKLDSLIGQFNIEGILNQIISSTINGLLTNLARDIFQITRDIIEDNIKMAVEDKIPTIQEEIGSIISETVPEVAERLIRTEIDKIKEDFQ